MFAAPSLLAAFEFGPTLAVVALMLAACTFWSFVVWFVCFRNSDLRAIGFSVALSATLVFFGASPLVLVFVPDALIDHDALSAEIDPLYVQYRETSEKGPAADKARAEIRGKMDAVRQKHYAPTIPTVDSIFYTMLGLSLASGITSVVCLVAYMRSGPVGEEGAKPEEANRAVPATS